MRPVTLPLLLLALAPAIGCGPGPAEPADNTPSAAPDADNSTSATPAEPPLMQAAMAVKQFLDSMSQDRRRNAAAFLTAADREWFNANIVPASENPFLNSENRVGKPERTSKGARVPVLLSIGEQEDDRFYECRIEDGKWRVQLRPDGDAAAPPARKFDAADWTDVRAAMKEFAGTLMFWFMRHGKWTGLGTGRHPLPDALKAFELTAVKDLDALGEFTPADITLELRDEGHFVIHVASIRAGAPPGYYSIDDTLNETGPREQ